MQGGESAGSSYLSLAIDGQPTFSDAKRDLRATGGVMSMGRGAAAARCRRYQLRRERTVMSPMKTAQRARSSPCKAFKARALQAARRQNRPVPDLFKISQPVAVLHPNNRDI